MGRCRDAGRRFPFPGGASGAGRAARQRPRVQGWAADPREPGSAAQRPFPAADVCSPQVPWFFLPNTRAHHGTAGTGSSVGRGLSEAGPSPLTPGALPPGRGKTVIRRRSTLPAELIDFFRFNAKFAWSWSGRPLEAYPQHQQRAVPGTGGTARGWHERGREALGLASPPLLPQGFVAISPSASLRSAAWQELQP